jgi:dTDP-4-amino-4,6-dideoxygalactose transaminase
MIPLFKVFMNENISKDLDPVLKSGFITQGVKVEEFEQKLIEFFGNKNLLTLNSATSGLTLALRLLMDKDKQFEWPGFNSNEDYVLSPALTCFATTASILANQVKIKWIDVDTNNGNVSIEDIQNKLNNNTKVVYIVHWGGYPVDLDKLKVLQDEHYTKYGYRFMIVEDCAHAFGATYKNKKLGNHGNICVFSLQAIKHLTCGDGGLIILPNEKMYERAKLLRWFGIDRNKRNYKGKDLRLENDILEYGYKFHMNDINATIGLSNLPYIPEILQKNKENCEYLYKNLINHPQISLLENNSDRQSANWLFTMKIKDKIKFMDKMKQYEIMVSQVHNRNDTHSCVKNYQIELPNLDKFEKEMICIPSGWWLSKEQLNYIIEKINLGW